MALGADEEVLVGGTNGGNTIEGGSVGVGRKDVVALSFETVIRMDPMSKRVGKELGMNVMANVVVSDSTMFMMVMFPTADITGTETDSPPADTETFMVALEVVDVSRKSADALN